MYLYSGPLKVSVKYSECCEYSEHWEPRVLGILDVLEVHGVLGVFGALASKVFRVLEALVPVCVGF